MLYSSAQAPISRYIPRPDRVAYQTACTPCADPCPAISPLAAQPPVWLATDIRCLRQRTPRRQSCCATHVVGASPAERPHAPHRRITPSAEGTVRRRAHAESSRVGKRSAPRGSPAPHPHTKNRAKRPLSQRRTGSRERDAPPAPPTAAKCC